jgi:hypothetical protein
MHDRRRTPVVERRQGQRARFIAAVRHEAGAAVELALAQNLGPAGMELKRPAGQGHRPTTPVSLAFELPDGGDLVRVRGAVVFERPTGMYQTSGVRFDAVSPRDRARILRALGSL